MRSATLVRCSLMLTGLGATAGAILHLVVGLSGRADWYRYFRSPEQVVESASAGGWFAPACAFGVAALMQAAALFAFAAAGLLPRPPHLRLALAALAAACLWRGLIWTPFVFIDPSLWFRIATFDRAAALIWASSGAGFAIGAWRPLAPKPNTVKVGSNAQEL